MAYNANNFEMSQFLPPEFFIFLFLHFSKCLDQLVVFNLPLRLPQIEQTINTPKREFMINSKYLYS